MLIELLIVLLLVMLGIQYAGYFYSPGDLVKGHIKLECQNCHTPFKRVSPETCSTEKCHPQISIGKTTTIVDLHKKTSSKNCLTCHTDHVGVNGKATKSFDHDILPSFSKCVECHKAEGDRVHKDRYSDDCASCHTTKSWKKISFFHEKAKWQKCIECHRIPKDEMHTNDDTKCLECHNTKAWKPSSYNHDKYFLIDKDHKVACSKCHDAGTYNLYTCLNCHEHATRKIIREHQKEGMRNFGDCLWCHRVTIGGRSYGENRSGESFKEDDD